MDGPGNFSIDAEGNLWVANNYAYSRQSRQPACGSDKIFRFTPTGQTYPGSPYVGGGLSGVGFGVAVDLSERVWAANFGFEGKGCETAANHTSVSLFNTAGETLSPEGGWEVGGISWPQGTVVDRHENVWLANCGNDSVTRIDGETVPSSPEGTPPTAINFPGAAITSGHRRRVRTPLRRRARRPRGPLRHRQREQHGRRAGAERQHRRDVHRRRPAPADGRRRRPPRLRLGLELEVGRRAVPRRAAGQRSQRKRAARAAATSP